MPSLTSWLDFKGALNGFYDEKIKATLENKSSEYKELLEKHANHWQNTQKVLVAIILGIFLLIAIYCFWEPRN